MSKHRFMSKKVLLLPAFLFLAASAFAQNKNTEPSDNGTKKIYSFVEKMPVPSLDIGQYLQKNLHYPADARKHHIQGRVILKFVVDEDGNITDCKIAKSIGGGCDEEAMRVLKSMPSWKPGMQDGKPVKVYYTLPISFQLE